MQTQVGGIRRIGLGMAAGVLVLACGSTDPSTGGIRTHPAGILGTPTPVPDQPFGINVLRSGKVIVTRLGGSFAILPDSGGAYVGAAAGLLPTDVASSKDGAYAYVTEQGSQALGRVTLSVPAVTSTVPVPFHPFRIVRSRSGAALYVTGDADTVLVINLASGARVAAYAMQVQQNGLAESADGRYLYVSSKAQGVVREISLTSGLVGRTFATGGTPQEVVLSADGSELYVADEGSNFVQVWNVAAGVKSDSIQIGQWTFGMALSPDGKRLYATSPSMGEVFIVDPVARIVLDSLPVGGTPRRVAFNATGTRAVIANEGGWVDFVN